MEANLSNFENINYCILICTYNNEHTLKRVIDGCLKYKKGNNILLVNDGCTDNSAQLLAEYDNNIILLENSKNKGKGFSLRKGFAKAIELGFDYAITIDSDGQHYPTDIPLFLNKIKETPNALLMGSRNMEHESVPEKSSTGNKISNFWFKVETGVTLPDTQTGFRLYPLKFVKGIKLFTTKFETEIELIVKLAWKNVEFIPIKINVLYDPNERVTHFRPFKDFTRITILNIYLVTLTVLWYIHIRIFRIIKNETLKKNESNLKKASSIGFGVFMGLIPIWGFQLIVGIPLSIFFKLNKVLFITSAHISIPPNIPFIVYFSYIIGGILVENETAISSFSNLTLESIHINFMQYLVGAIVLSIGASLISFLTSLGLLSIFRKNK